MTTILKTQVAYGSRGQRTEGYVALTWAEAVDGFKAAYGRDADTVSEGSAFYDPAIGDIRMEPALSDAYGKPIKGNRSAIFDAAMASHMQANQLPALQPATGGVDVFFDAMDDELAEDYE